MRPARALVWLSTLCCSIWLLHRLGEGPLAGPPASLGGVQAWLARTTPAVAPLAVLRLVALAAAVYLTVATAVRVAADTVGWARLVRLADLLEAPAVRPVVRYAVGAGIGAAVLSPAAVLAAEPPPGDVIVLLPESGDAPPTTAPRSPAAEPLAPATPVAPEAPAAPDAAAGWQGGDSGTASMHVVTEEPAAPPAVTTAEPVVRAPRGADILARHAEPTAPTPAPAPAAQATPAPDAAVATLGGDDVWLVEAGDHLWSIAEETLTDSWGHPAPDGEIERYWRALVDANRDRLLHPADPDLVFRGQVIALPPVPPPPAA